MGESPTRRLGTRAEKRMPMGYSLSGSGEARSRLFDISNASPKLTLVRPAELIAATRRLVSARRKLAFLSHLSPTFLVLSV